MGEVEEYEKCVGKMEGPLINDFELVSYTVVATHVELTIFHGLPKTR